MSYNRSYNNHNSSNYGNGGAGQDAPPTTTVLVGNGRMATLSCYSDNRGVRKCTYALSTLRDVPNAIAGAAEVLYFGTNDLRETTSVPEAIEVCKAWVRGESARGEVL